MSRPLQQHDLMLQGDLALQADLGQQTDWHPDRTTDGGCMFLCAICQHGWLLSEWTQHLKAVLAIGSGLKQPICLPQGTCSLSTGSSLGLAPSVDQ